MKLPPEEQLDANFILRNHVVSWVKLTQFSSTAVFLKHQKDGSDGPRLDGDVVMLPNGIYVARLYRQCGDISPTNCVGATREQAMRAFVRFVEYGRPYDPRPIPHLDHLLKASGEEIYQSCTATYQKED